MMRSAMVTAVLAAMASTAAAQEVEAIDRNGTVTLRNEFVEVQVSPAHGMYVRSAKDLASGRTIVTDLKLNFPYFEHGIKDSQPSGYRILKGPDGSVTVAMNMRFAHHKGPQEVERYGRFGERILSEFVTLRPGQGRFEFRGRVDNPTPLRRSDRLWDRALLPTTDDMQFIMPVSHGVEHSALWIKSWPRWTLEAADGQSREIDVSLWKNWRQPGVKLPTQYFGLYSRYGFSGAWYPGEGVNRLRINHPLDNPGMKVYCGGAFELWGGTTVVFEDPGRFIDGYVPTEQTQVFYIASRIGRVDYADKDFAIHAPTGAAGSVQLTGPLPRKNLRLIVTEPDVRDGKVEQIASAAGEIGPGRALQVQLPRALGRYRVVVAEGDQLLLDQVFPLPIPDTSGRYEAVRKACDQRNRIDYIELQEHSNHRGMPTALSASNAAARLLDAEDPSVEAMVSIANACYRIGDFGNAIALTGRVLKAEPKNAHAHHVLGLIAYEKGELRDAQKQLLQSGEHGWYLLALMELSQRNKTNAMGIVGKLMQVRRQAYRPRMLLAYLLADAASGQAGPRKNQMQKLALQISDQLVQENAASPEACETQARVAALLGQDDLAARAREAVAQLLKNNPDAERQLGLFRQELDKGVWVYPGRYKQELPTAE